MTTLVSFPASFVSTAHTSIAAFAFSSALFLAWFSGLWEELCINSVATWPVEWFPSVSATIGDHAPTRAPFHILIALCATPRFVLLLVQWIAHRYPLASAPSPSSVESRGKTTAVAETGVRTRAAAKAAEIAETVTAPVDDALKHLGTSGAYANAELFVGIARTVTCGGWMYITSRDNHDIHDLFMIVYLVLNLPWMYFTTLHSTTDKARKRRQFAFAGFLLSIPPLIWLFYRHSVLHIPGAYTHYAFLEWSLVFWDILFDSVAITELSHLRIAIVDASGETKESGSVYLAPSKQSSTKVYDESDWTSEGKTENSRAVLAWASDLYFAVCFWTVFTSLGVQLFYWSVWKLALAGTEAALLANLSAFTLAWKSNRAYVTSKDGILTHRAITIVAGLGCYIIPSPAARLLGISIGTWTGWLALYGDLVRLRGSRETVAEGQTLSLGLIITMLLKYVNYSINPLWATNDGASGGWNKTALLLGAAGLYEYATRPTSLFPSPTPLEKDKPVVTSSTRLQRTAIIVAFGSLIHMLQTFNMDAGTIISWTWTGFPIKGPTLHPWASVVIAVAAASSIWTPTFPTWPIGLTGAYVLYAYPDWLGFVGGVALVGYLASTFPRLLRAAAALSPAKTFGNAQITNIILDVASVITTAYAFVPYGWILRERTDLIVGFSMLSIVAGEWAAAGLTLPQTLYPRANARIALARSLNLLAVLVISIIAITVSYVKIPVTPVPYYPDHRIFSGGIFTVHFGVDEPGHDSQRRIMELVRDMQVDVLGLLESDLHRFVYGNRDLTRVMAEELGYYVDLGPGPNKHTWGAALLSKFPILNSTHHLLPSPHGELAPAIHATLDIHGEKVNIWVSHNGQEEDALDRELQTTEIARNLAATADVPTVFLGYLVTHPGDERPWPYQILITDGQMLDIEYEDWWRWCEYIAFRGLWRIGYARLHEGDISDTELQVGKFILPKPGQTVFYATNEELYWHIGEDDVPEPWRFPAMFRDEGVRGHYYRVWVGPVYYFPPEESGVREYGWNWTTTLD